MNDAIMMIIM